MNSSPSENPLTVHRLLTILVQNKGSDLHLQAGELPVGRFDDRLGRVEMDTLTEADALRLAREILITETVSTNSFRIKRPAQPKYRRRSRLPDRRKCRPSTYDERNHATV